MKKFSAIIASFLALGAFTATSIAASACGHGNRGHHSYAAAYSSAVTTNPAARHYFIDNNGDGICENCGGSVCLTNGLCAGHNYHNANGYFIDNNGDGICDNCGSGVCLLDGHCSVCYRGNGYFIDNNNDGICDNCGSGVCLLNGHCSVCYRGNGYFIDNNNDGICDNCQSGVCQQHGTGINHHYGRGCHH